MLLGVLILLAPIALFVAAVPASRILKQGLRKFYLILGGILVFVGTAISFYLAGYGGDQGGIAAYFFQMSVILGYALFSMLVLAANWVLRRKGKRTHES